MLNCHNNYAIRFLLTKCNFLYFSFKIRVKHDLNKLCLIHAFTVSFTKKHKNEKSTFSTLMPFCEFECIIRS